MSDFLCVLRLTSGVSRAFSSRTSLTVSPTYWEMCSSGSSCTATVSWTCISACHSSTHTGTHVETDPTQNGQNKKQTTNTGERRREACFTAEFYRFTQMCLTLSQLHARHKTEIAPSLGFMRRAPRTPTINNCQSKLVSLSWSERGGGHLGERRPG